jgi:glycogen operon protein
MLLHGDEVARTQRGNNNAYCQDSVLTWKPWELTLDQCEMLEWTKRLVRLRKDHTILRRRNYFRGRPIRGSDTKDILWLRPDGHEMSEREWLDENVRSLAVYLAGSASDVTDDEGRPILDDSLLLLLSSSDEVVDFRLPPSGGQRWRLVLDTTRSESPEPDPAQHSLRGRRYQLGPRSMAILAHRVATVPPGERFRLGAGGELREDRVGRVALRVTAPN